VGNRFSILPAILLIAGCYTHYQPAKGIGNGYTEEKLDPNTFRVSFRGNRYTPVPLAHRYLFRRCAELTKAGGADYFVLVDVADSVGTPTSPRDPLSQAVIRIFKGPRPITVEYAYDAQEILDSVTP